MKDVVVKMNLLQFFIFSIPTGTTLLNRAVNNTNVGLVRYLLRNGADVNKQVNGLNPIHKTILQNKMELFQLLIEHEADINQPVSNGNSPLHLALEKRNLQMAEVLIRSGADTMLKNRQGDTPLHLAAKVSFAESFCLLVEHGANVHVVNREGKTALDIASEQKGFEGTSFIEWLS